MFAEQNKGEPHWDTYSALERRLLRLSYLIGIDDSMMDIYSMELAGIICTACERMEILAKEIYDHMVDFKDTDSKLDPGKSAEHYTLTPDSFYLFEINKICRIDRCFVGLKPGCFSFQSYEKTIFPFANITADGPVSGVWDYSKIPGTKETRTIEWQKGYLALRESKLYSVAEYGTVINAIVTLSAFCVLVRYHSRLILGRSILSDGGIMHSELFLCNI